MITSDYTPTWNFCFPSRQREFDSRHPLHTNDRAKVEREPNPLNCSRWLFIGYFQISKHFELVGHVGAHGLLLNVVPVGDGDGGMP